MSNTEPLIDTEVDLRDFDYMPLHGERLFNSDTWLLCNSNEKVAALRLWWASWHQEPGGSLPADDRLLANLAGYGIALREFKRVKENAMRGWIRCSDGRLYHPVICQIAASAWAGKRKKATEHARDRERKRRKRGHVLPDSEVVSAGNPTETALKGRDVEVEEEEEKEEQEGKEAEQEAAPLHGVNREAALTGELLVQFADHDQDPPELRVIMAFDRARVQAFGGAQARAFPQADDRQHAQRFIGAGASVDDCFAIFMAIMQRAATAGRQPPANLAYMAGPVADAIATRDRPMPEGRPSTQFFDPAEAANRIIQKGAA